MTRAPAIALTLVCSALSAGAEEVRQVKLAASLFGETVGEIDLTFAEGAQSTIRYRSDVLVVRDQLRFRSRASIDSTFDPASGKLIRSTARRCTAPEDGSNGPKCGSPVEQSKGESVPALAAELILARAPDGRERCIRVIDEESGEVGEACATPRRTSTSVELTGSKLGEPFTAVVRDGLLVELTLPQQGARFVQVTGKVEVSDDDLFAEPVPSRGDPRPGIRTGALRVLLSGMPQAVAMIREAEAVGQTVEAGIDGASVHVQVKRSELPKGKKARDILTRASLLMAKARGQHADCQAASSWFAAEAKARGWKTEPAVGIAYVDGRFAFHEWVVIRTADGRIPVDPLLAQVPADAGHIQLSSAGGSAGGLLVQFRRGLSIAVE